MKYYQYLLVGITLLGALSLLGYFTIVSDEGPFAEEGSHIIIYLDHAQGLQKGSKITLLGIQVGRIEQINLIPVEGKDRKKVNGVYPGHKVAVTAGVKKPFVFYSNYKIQVKNESLLEQKVIALDPGSAVNMKTKEKNHALPVLFIKEDDLGGMTALDYFLLKKKSMEVHELSSESGKDPLAVIAGMFAENRHDVRRTIRNTAQITDKINTGKGTAGLLVNDDELHHDAHTLVNEGEVVVRDMRKSSEDKREGTPYESLFRLLIMVGL